MTSAIDHLTALLNDLAERTADREMRDFTQAVGIVNDLGRLVVRGREADIRQAQAAASAVREQLSEVDGAILSPGDELTSGNSRSFLGGALWAASEIMTTRLEAVPLVADGGRATRKDQVKDSVLAALVSHEAQSPTAIMQSIAERDSDIRLDEVSRALSELLVLRLVDVATPEPCTDRRMKHFALTSQGRALADERFGFA
jgi:hypothetical protein